MKELSIEQKAQRYDEVVNKLKVFMAKGVDPLITRADVKDFFPELQERNGERIRKWLIDTIKSVPNDSIEWDVIEKSDVLAWLEKQGELPHWKKSTLPNDNVTGFNSDYFSYNGYYINYKELFNKLPKDNFDFEKQGEQKPAWSEEDKMFVHGLIRGLAAKRDIHGHTTFSSDCIDITETINWLKSLKDRMQPKQEWSEEDERVRIALFLFVEAYGAYANYEVTQEEMLSWLKSLRPQNRWKPSDEQMDALEDAIADAISSIQKNMLNSLYTDLKKLKEESNHGI